MVRLRAPMTVFISLTYRCNFTCSHCAVYSDQTTYTDLSTESWLDFFDELAAQKVFRVRLSGGEPFMREDIWDLLDALDRQPFRFSINTNASLIDKKDAERLRNYSKLDAVMVSLDGSCPQIYDAQRGPGTFRRVKRGIDQLAAAGLPLFMYCTVTKHNWKDLKRISQLAVRWGASSMKFNYLLPEGRGLRNYQALALDTQEWKRALRELRSLSAKHGNTICGTILDVGRIFDAMETQTENESAENPSSCLSGCKALSRECAVRPDGWITPCDRMPGACAGHIHEHRFGEIWRSAEIFTQFRKRNQIRISTIEECRDCAYQSQCRGGCPAVPYSLYGNFNTRDPLSCYRIHSGREAFNVH